MRTFRIKMLKSSVNTELRLFDVTASNMFEAAKQATAKIFGEPFQKDDLLVQRKVKYLFINTNQFQAKHKNMETLHCLLEIDLV